MIYISILTDKLGPYEGFGVPTSDNVEISKDALWLTDKLIKFVDSDDKLKLEHEIPSDYFAFDQNTIANFTFHNV